MALSHSKKRLLERLLDAVKASRWQCLIVDGSHPFLLRLFESDHGNFDVRVYIWQCTHGGGAARASDEFRVQLTGAVPAIDSKAQTLLLGFHGGYGVFVGFDVTKHAGQVSSSPSIQVKEAALQKAHADVFSIYKKDTGEMAVAFRPEFFVQYALGARSLHATGKAAADLSLLNDLANLTDAKIEAMVSDERRKRVLRRFLQSYRSSDFRKRVLGAYAHACAVCGLQLDLVDAAHILPVQAAGSTDATNNGIALCRLHHAAFDKALISVNEQYKVEVSGSETARLTAANLAGGLPEFRKTLLSGILLPYDREDYPDPAYIRRGRTARRWVA